jgi:hypothetical protein
MRIAAFVAGALAIPVLALAQTAPTSAVATTAAALSDRAAADPTLRSIGRGTAPGIAFQFSNDKTTATAQVGGGLGWARRWGLTVSGPLGKGTTTTLATREGLNSGVSGELLLRQITLSEAPPITVAQIMELCREHLRAEFRAGFASTGNCTRAQLDDAGQQLFDAEGFDPVWAFGASAKVGRNTFDYSEPTAFTDQSETHDGWSASVSVGRFQSERSLAALLYYVGASFRHEQAYRGGSARNICTPIASSSSSYCRQIATVAPRRETSNLVQVEARSFIGRSVGLAPRATFEVSDSEWEVEVPVYLRDVQGPFNGGVSLGWNSTDKDLSISLFVGALPKIFP